MKRLTTLLLALMLTLLLAACSVNINNGTNSSQRENNDKVSADKVWILVSRERIYPNGEQTTKTYNYDKNNNFLSAVILNADGTETVSGVTYLYDDNNNLLEKSGTYTRAQGDPWYETDSYTYDKNGNCIEFLKTKDGVKQNHKIYSPSGTVLEHTEYEDGVPHRYYLYDVKENLLKAEYYEDGILNLYFVYTYDDNGNQTEKTAYTSQGERSGTWELYFYNESNDMIQSEYYRDHEKFSVCTYTYDNNHNKLTYSYRCDAAQSQFHYTYTYDQSGNKIEQTLTDEEGTKKWIWQYDAQGNLLAEKAYDASGNEESAKIYTYNNNGKITEYKYTDQEGHWKGNVEVQLIEHYKHTYDENGKELSYWYYSWLDDDLSDCIRNYSYERSFDTNGNMSEYIQYNGNGDKEYQDIYSYDANSNVTGRTHYDKNGEEAYRIVYTYDENGNLTELVQYSGGQEEYRYQYTYQRVHVTAKDAERILAQQKELLPNG